MNIPRDKSPSEQNKTITKEFVRIFIQEVRQKNPIALHALLIGYLKNFVLNMLGWLSLVFILSYMEVNPSYVMIPSIFLFCFLTILSAKQGFESVF